MIKGYSCVVEGTCQGDISGRKEIECLPINRVEPIASQLGASGFALGHMKTGLFSGVTLLSYYYPEKDNLLPVSEKEYRLVYLIIGKKKACKKARRKLEKMFGFSLEEEEFDLIRRSER